MSSGQPGSETPVTEVSGRRAELTTPDVLRLLSSGATGAILMALGEGSLRTKELTERVPGYAPRTIYRYANKLAEIGVIDREEEPGVPSKVVHSLSEPCGRELYELVNAYASASLGRLPNGEIGAHAWGSLGLLADLWESGMVDELNFGPRTATELARMGHGLSYHQVSRRASLFAIGGFIHELPDHGRRRRYALTEKARRAMALVAAIGRWRRRHVLLAPRTGLSPEETAGLLRTALPLVSLPRHAGKSFKIDVVSADHGPEDEGELVWAEVEPDGTVLGCASPDAYVDGWGRGRVEAWVDSVLDGPHNGLHLGGDGSLIKGCLTALHHALWKRPDAES
jgi:DNA-binding HxlR family transcriptional regulator